MNSLGWIVPTYPPRKDFLSKLLATFESFSHDTDLIVVWSYHRDNFLISETHNNVVHLYLENHFLQSEIEIFEKTKSIINIKYVFAIILLYQKYEGLVGTDDELEFIRSFSGAEIIKKMRKVNHFPTTDISEQNVKDNVFERVLNECAKLLENKHDQNAIKELTENYKQFSWFADIPFYDSELVPNFLEAFGLTDIKDLTKLNYYTFHHILYQYFCVLRGLKNFHCFDWEYKQIGVYNWFECFHLENAKHLKAKQYQEMFRPLWCSSFKLPSVFENAICVFHTDRIDTKVSKINLAKHHIKALIKIYIPNI